jgi:hypothetical protein
MEKLQFFGNFFTKFYINHIHDGKIDSEIVKEDRTKALVYSIALGVFTLGIAHLVCWALERSVVPQTKDDDVINRTDDAAREALKNNEEEGEGAGGDGVGEGGVGGQGKGNPEDDQSPDTPRGGAAPLNFTAAPVTGGGSPPTGPVIGAPGDKGVSLPNDGTISPAHDLSGGIDDTADVPPAGQGEGEVKDAELDEVPSNLLVPVKVDVHEFNGNLQSLFSGPNIAKFIEMAQNDPILQKTSLYKDLGQLKQFYEKLNAPQVGGEDVETVLPDEITKQHAVYLALHSKAQALQIASKEEFPKILEHYRNLHVFISLRENQFDVMGKVESLKEREKGILKANMQALFSLISPAVATKSSSSEEEVVEDLEKSLVLNEEAADAAVGYEDPEKAFAAFQLQIEAEENNDAKHGWVIYKEVIGSVNYEENTLLDKFSRYQRVEVKVLQGAEDLEKSFENLLKRNSDPKEDLEKIRKVFKSIDRYLSIKPSLKDLFLKNTPHASQAYLYIREIKNQSDLASEISTLMKVNFGVLGKIRLDSLVNSGKEVLKNPEKYFDKYLMQERGLSFVDGVTQDLIVVSNYLEKIVRDFDQRSYTPEDLLALEAFVCIALYTYTINPKNVIDPQINTIQEHFQEIRRQIQEKSQGYSLDELNRLRETPDYQKFYQYVKERFENTPGYPKDFWFDPKQASHMKMEEPLLKALGRKISDPDWKLVDDRDYSNRVSVVHTNEQLGYEMYFYKPDSNEEKPKLLIFYTKEPGNATFQQINHQLGLFGDGTILKSAEDVVSNLTSLGLLEGYQQDLQEGNIEVLTAGFGNGGSAGAVVAHRLAVVYPKAHITSIGTGSTTLVTTEEAYNMNQAENFLSIRLLYANDRNIDRTLEGMRGDFSNDTYKTFPLLVRYNVAMADINRHNKEEYGNIDNFIPAMKNPLLLQEIHQEFSCYIHYRKPEEKELPVEKSPDLNDSLIGEFEKVKGSQSALGIGNLDELINLGSMMRANVQAYTGMILRLEQNKMDLVARPEPEAPLEEGVGGFWSYFGIGKNEPPSVQKVALTREQEENTATALQQATNYLSNPKIRDRMTVDQVFSLLVAADTLLVNYAEMNTSVGKIPQITDLISEMRNIALNRLEEFYEKGSKGEVDALFKKEERVFNHLAKRIREKFPGMQEKEDVLRKTGFEDRFWEFLGFKIALPNDTKLGSHTYTAKLHFDRDNQYDLTLYTPENPNQKQRIVVSCYDKDVLGNHSLQTGEFGAGDKQVLERALRLKDSVEKSLEQAYKTYDIDPNSVDIVVVGFGSEGAVSTALGFYLSDKYEKNQVSSIAFGAPRFTTEEGANKIRKRKNFVPIRLLSPNDVAHEAKWVSLGDYKMSDRTYYNLPFQFRILGINERLTGHSTNLYGDPQNIRSSIKRTEQLRAIAGDKRRFTSKEQPRESEVRGASFQKRVFIDTQKITLKEYSGMSVKQIEKVEPGKLIAAMKYSADLSQNEDLSDEDKVAIQKFFSVFIQAMKNADINEKSKIENRFCKKMFDHGYKPDQLFGGKWQLQKMLSQELAEAMDAVQDYAGDKDSKEYQELVLKRSYYRGLLAGDLNGNRYKPAGGGVNGAVFFRHLEAGSKNLLHGEEGPIPFLGVFKPHPMTVQQSKSFFDPGQFAERCKAVVGMDSHLNHKDPHKRVHNEIFAYELFHIFKFSGSIGFPTTLQFINKNDPQGRPASFCAFIPGLDIVASHVKSVTKEEALSNILDAKRAYGDEELHIWQMSKIFDFVTGNMDGHEGNAFVEVKKKKVVGAVNFDYDKAFATEDTPLIANQYKWGNLTISKQAITQKTRDVLSELLKEPDCENKIQEFLTGARKDGEGTQNFTEDQEKLLRARIEVLRKVVSGEIKTLSDLAERKRLK